ILTPRETALVNGHRISRISRKKLFNRFEFWRQNSLSHLSFVLILSIMSHAYILQTFFLSQPKCRFQSGRLCIHLAILATYSARALAMNLRNTILSEWVFSTAPKKLPI